MPNLQQMMNLMSRALSKTSLRSTIGLVASIIVMVFVILVPNTLLFRVSGILTVAYFASVSGMKAGITMCVALIMLDMFFSRKVEGLENQDIAVDIEAAEEDPMMAAEAALEEAETIEETAPEDSMVPPMEEGTDLRAIDEDVDVAEADMVKERAANAVDEMERKRTAAEMMQDEANAKQDEARAEIERDNTRIERAQYVLANREQMPLSVVRKAEKVMSDSLEGFSDYTKLKDVEFELQRPRCGKDCN